MLYRMKDAKPIKLGFNPFAKGFTDGELKDAFYRLTCDPKQQLLILESCSLEEADGEYGGDEPTCDGCTADCGSCGMKRDDGMVLEAVRVRAFSRTTQTMAALQRSLNKYMADKGLTVGEAVVGKPKKSGLFATVTVQFPVSDGQAITIIFHSPDGNKLTITAADEILAFRWLLNKRDITVAVAPEGEADVSLEEVGNRVAMLVEKNSKAFQSKSKEIADQKGQLADLTTQVATAQGEVAALQANFAELEQVSAEIDGQIEQTTAQLSKVQEFNAGLQQKISELQAVQAGNSGKAKGETKGYESGAAAYEAALTALGFAADENNPDSKSFILRYVDENWGKAGAGSQTMEKITTAYGVEPDGTVAVIVGGAGANKKFTAKSVATAKNAFDKATDLVTELAGQVTSMDAWLAKYGPSVATVNVGDKFKVLINRRRPADGYYGAPGIVTSIGEATDGNNPGLPAVRLSIGETTISAFAYNAWAMAVSSREVVPWDENTTIIDATSPDGYAQISADMELKLKYQDVLDPFFTDRIADVRESLRGLGWGGGENGTALTKGTNPFYTSGFSMDKVGAGKNVVGVQYFVSGGDVKFFLDDDLTKTPAEIAGALNAAIPTEKGTNIGKTYFVITKGINEDTTKELPSLEAAETYFTQEVETVKKTAAKGTRVWIENFAGDQVGNDYVKPGTPDTSSTNPDEYAAVTTLNDIVAGKYGDSGSISDALDDAAAKLEGAGLMETYDVLLNQAADYLTEVLKKEAA